MSQIFKYPLEICDARITHHMPKGARPLCVQNQRWNPDALCSRATTSMSADT